MHFRFRGNNIQVIKSQIDPATGKAKSVPLGSINRANLAVSEKLKQNCSPAELREIEEWVKVRMDVDSLRRKVVALTLAERIALATEWFAKASPDEARAVADDVFVAMMRLRSMLNKRGLI